MITPRRLLAFLAVFLTVAGAYFLLTWRERQQEQAHQAAKRLFPVKEAEVTAVTLKKGGISIHLEKKGDTWQITRPVMAQADMDIVPSFLTTLASLSKDRDLEQEQNLAPFGLDRPSFMVEFTAGGKAHKLAVGNPTPGKQGYYALADQKNNLLTIRAADKEALDRPLTALRDKTLFAFSLDKVKAVKIRLNSRQVDLEKNAPTTWKWLGREGVKVRADRLESLLRRLDMARIKDFVAETPTAKELAAFGLAKPLGVLTIEEDKRTETLFLGVSQKQDLFARKASAGPVVLVEERLRQEIEKTLASLEDLRLWSGDPAQVQKVIWGPPDRPWTAVKEEKAWELSSPGQKILIQPGLRLEMVLQKLRDLEYSRLAPAAKSPDQTTFRLELWETPAQHLIRLMETGKREKDLIEVSLERQGNFQLALVSLKDYQELKDDLTRLTKAPGKNRE